MNSHDLENLKRKLKGIWLNVKLGCYDRAIFVAFIVAFAAICYRFIC